MTNVIPEFFADDGIIPNSRLPVVYMKFAFRTTEFRHTFGVSPAVGEPELKQLVKQHGWKLAWTWRVYKFTHWHSTAHEGLLCIKGDGRLWLGGPRVGKEFLLQPGDAVFIPAGVAHRNIEASYDFTVCGIYPEGQEWDLIKGAKTFSEEARKRTTLVPLPTQDPLFGKNGPLMRHWTLQKYWS